MQIINENRETPRERRKYVRNQQRRERLKGKFDYKNLSPITLLLAAVLWMVIVMEVMEQLCK